MTSTGRVGFSKDLPGRARFWEPRRAPSALKPGLSWCGHQQSMVPLFRLPVLFALAAGARRRAFVDAGCRCQPARALRPNCPVGKLPADMDYRRTGGALPLAMCIGDSVSGPSCRAAAAGLADRIELRSVEFPRASGGRVLLNGMTSANVRKCMGSWMGSVPWRAVVFGAGAWDLQTNGCCETDAAHLQRIVDNMRNIVQTILTRAEMAVWVTTAPIAETRACCKSELYNYSQPVGLPDTYASIGYCHADAQRQNAAVAAMLAADFPPARVAIADTHSAVSGLVSSMVSGIAGRI